MSKPILCLDFDGVIHSYTSGWLGPRVIQDAPIPGALQFLAEALDHFDVHIFSSRSHQHGGRRAMKKWLVKEYCELASTYETTPEWLMEHIYAFADPWPDQVGWDMKALVARIQFPTHKPPALVTIDDRAITFTGTWPSLEGLKQFKPWNKS